MPRPKVDPRFRRRVAHACESSRRVEGACRYSKYPRPASQDDQLTSGHPDGEARLELAVLGDRSSASLLTQVDIPVANSSPLFKDSQMLEDSRDKFIYVGESASLSFLETVRGAIRVAVGPCAFTNEPARNHMLESTPKIRFETAQEPSLDLATAQSLARQFFLAVSGILDLFDPPWLMAQLQDWVDQPSRMSKTGSAIIHLTIAIGSQGRASGELDELFAEQCFAYGRQLTMFNLLNDLSLATIQAVTLISYYMMAACQYDAAFINLGLASRAAYTLGIHLHETNKAFGGEEVLARERAWKSLRVCDLFLAASLGRPPATSAAASKNDWAPIKSARECERPGAARQVFSATFRICNVFERILLEVYAEKAVSLDLAISISRQHRQWTEELPQTLMVDGLEESDAGQDSDIFPRRSRISSRHGCRMVTMAYYYSIVLLTRPFLTLQIRHASTGESRTIDSSSTQASLATYSDACVNSAIRGIDNAYEYVFELDTPKRQPFVVNNVFISALCLGLAYLDTSGRLKWPVDRSLDRAIKILAHLAGLNTQSARYAGICRQLKEAVTIYTTRKDDTLLRANNRIVQRIFGDVRATLKHQYYNEGSMTNTDSPQRPIWGVPADESMVLTMTPLFDFNTTQEESKLPTPGLSPGQITNFPRSHDQYGSDVGDEPACNALDSLSAYFLDQYSAFPHDDYCITGAIP
ncbi:hypothetical protein TruAng_001897 [Truncatella angustata]|nr:hypothetical protein TruAng_001897 [Truncatella angustata]